jgi:hypothetical protein
LQAELDPLWGDSSNTRRLLQWRLFMKVGRQLET